MPHLKTTGILSCSRPSVDGFDGGRLFGSGMGYQPGGESGYGHASTAALRTSGCSDYRVKTLCRALDCLVRDARAGNGRLILMKREIHCRWRLPELMATRGLHNSPDLVPLLKERGIELSASQVYRQVTQRAYICDRCEDSRSTPGRLVQEAGSAGPASPRPCAGTDRTLPRRSRPTATNLSVLNARASRRTTAAGFAARKRSTTARTPPPPARYGTT